MKSYFGDIQQIVMFCLGCHDIPNALTIQKNLVAFFAKGQFQLSKWSSNASELLNSIPENEKETPLYFRSPDELFFSILDFKWLLTTD